MPVQRCQTGKRRRRIGTKLESTSVLVTVQTEKATTISNVRQFSDALITALPEGMGRKKE